MDGEMINEKSGTVQLNLSTHYPLRPDLAISKISSDDQSERYLHRQPYENYCFHTILIRIMKISFIFIIRSLWNNPDFQDISYISICWESRRRALPENQRAMNEGF